MGIASGQAFIDKIVEQCASEGIVLKPHLPMEIEQLSDGPYAYVGDSPYADLREVLVHGRRVRVYISESLLPQV